MAVEAVPDSEEAVTDRHGTGVLRNDCAFLIEGNRAGLLEPLGPLDQRR